MFRLTLGKKLFVALSFLLALLLLVFVIFSRVGLQRGIGQYVAEIELSRLDWLVSNLQSYYAAEGSWQPLKANPQLWRSIARPAGPRQQGPEGASMPRRGPTVFEALDPQGRPPPGFPGDMPRNGPPDMDAGRPPPMMGGLGGMEGQGGQGKPGELRGPPGLIYSRLALLDATGTTLVVGSERALESGVRSPVMSKGATVGYLALAPLAGIQTESDRAFVAEQSRFVIYTGLIGLLLALLISGWLARKWLAPVDKLIEGATAVSEGKLGHVVEVTGQDEFSTLTQTFNTMSIKLAAIEASRQRWLSDVAHELRTPVAAMRGEIEALQDGVRSFDGTTASRLHGQVMRLGKLVEDLRLVSQDSHELSIAHDGVCKPLEALIEVAQAMGRRFETAGLTLEGLEQLKQLAASNDIEVRGDGGRLSQVFTNLLENSVRYTDSGGKVRLDASIRRGAKPELSMVFEDSAPQPAQDDFPKLFDRFYRGETSRNRSTGGSGLGLPICKAIVAAHHGSIAASASPMGGLRMTVTLPISS